MSPAQFFNDATILSKILRSRLVCFQSTVPSDLYRRTVLFKISVIGLTFWCVTVRSMLYLSPCATPHAVPVLTPPVRRKPPPNPSVLRLLIHRAVSSRLNVWRHALHDPALAHAVSRSLTFPTCAVRLLSLRGGRPVDYRRFFARVTCLKDVWLMACQRLSPL
jgi:hypothetical protein